MNKLKILLADDHESFRRILCRFLKMHNKVGVVEEASDGMDAVEKAVKLCPDLIFMDIHMPRQNGIEAARIIKNKFPAIRVFILSTDINEFYKRNMKGLADGFIAKSSMKEELLSILSNETIPKNGTEKFVMAG